MGLAEFQTALARLYTDRSYRQLLQNDEQAFADSAQVSKEDIAQLRSMADEIEEFARSLIAKRLGEVRKRLPLSSRVLSVPDFSSAFQRYADAERSAADRGGNGTSPVGDMHRQDAITFVESLERCGLQQPKAPAWTIDLLRYESAWLQMADSGRRFLLNRFRFPMSRLTQALAAGATTSSIPARSSLGLWWRYRHDGRVRHLCWE